MPERREGTFILQQIIGLYGLHYPIFMAANCPSQRMKLLAALHVQRQGIKLQEILNWLSLKNIPEVSALVYDTEEAKLTSATKIINNNTLKT